MTNTLSREVLQETVDTYNKLSCNQTAAARALGLSRSALQDRLQRATEQGVGSHFTSEPHDDTPEGLVVKGTSTYYGHDVKPRGQWVKTRGVPLDQVMDAIKAAFGEPSPEGIAESLAMVQEAQATSVLTNVYPIADLHFGMYAWKEETGDDYDTAIAAQTLNDAFTGILARSPTADTGIVLNLGDFFHSDNDEQRTRRSGNKLDVDTRYARVQREGVSLLRRIVDMAKTKHKLVIVKNIPGNHDPYGALALTTAMAMHYESDPRVVVDTAADPIWTYAFGRTLICAAHGDMVKPQELAGTIAGSHSEKWGRAAWRYGYLGHTHQRKVYRPDMRDSMGMEIEVFRTVAPPDAWGHSMGHTPRRSLVSITHHYDRGEVSRQTVNIGGEQ